MAVDMQYCVSFRCVQSGRRMCTLQRVPPLIGLVPMDPTPSPCNVGTVSPALHFHSCGYLSLPTCTSSSPHRFHPVPKPPPFWPLSVCPPKPWICFCFVLLVFFFYTPSVSEISQWLKASPGDSISRPYQIAIQATHADSPPLCGLSRVPAPSSPQAGIWAGTPPRTLSVGSWPGDVGALPIPPGARRPLGPESCP